MSLEYVYELTFAHGGTAKFLVDFEFAYADIDDRSSRLCCAAEQARTGVIDLEGSFLEWGPGCRLRELGRRREVL